MGTADGSEAKPSSTSSNSKPKCRIRFGSKYQNLADCSFKLGSHFRKYQDQNGKVLTYNNCVPLARLIQTQNYIILNMALELYTKNTKKIRH